LLTRDSIDTRSAGQVAAGVVTAGAVGSSTSTVEDETAHNVDDGESDTATAKPNDGTAHVGRPAGGTAT
jgi:hypothetical protein